MSGSTVTWASADASVATVDGSGLVTAAGDGTVTITVTAGSASGTAMVTVAQSVSAVAVAPAAEALVAGDTLRLAAAATDANGHPVPGAEFSWASSDSVVVAVDATGLVTALAPGIASVTATSGSATAAARLTVEAARVAVTPEVVVLAALGDTARLAATVLDRNGREVPGVAVSWTSRDSTVAAVDSTGLVTAAGAGETTVTATSGTVSASASVTVMQTASTVAISPARATLLVGDTLRLTATATDANGHPVAGAEFSWASSDSAVASVDSFGLVRGVAEGVAAITAALGSAEETAEIVVETDPNRYALVALYEATDGPNWVNNDGWITDRPLGEWYGVTADSTGVVSLVLSENGLSGTIPPQIGLLQSLKILNLSRNRAMAGSRLDASHDVSADVAELAMPEPPTIQNSADARRTGRGSAGRGDGTGLRGPIPPELGNLANLELLYLGENNLSGEIPATIKHLVSLRVLYLNDNHLSGPIPPEFGSLRNLAVLALWQNDLSGRIPPELGHAASLEAAYLTDNDLSGPIPPELGSLRSLRHLYLWGNRLSGPIPQELGNLDSMTALHLSGNELSGPVPSELGRLAALRVLAFSWNELSGLIPESFLELRALESFWFSGNTDLCAPGTTGFVTWREGMEETSGPYCNASDMAVLERLHETAGGTDWANSSGWLETPALEQWYGATANSLGRVVALDLTGNGLTGELRADLGSLGDLTALRIGDNALTGRLPLSLAELPPLDELHYAGTGLCAPAELASWLDGIPSHEGSGVVCGPLRDREVLVELYETMDGRNWEEADNWRTDAPLEEWYGVVTDGFGRVVELDLSDNGLTGPILPELSDLVALESLSLRGNELLGRIPPELGQLPALEALNLGAKVFPADRLTGPIPPELGNLETLRSLQLYGHSLTGPVPPALGDLANLRSLSLSRNRLSGPIPPEFGNLSGLASLGLTDNELTGSIPPALGDLANLSWLSLSNNRLEDPIPPELAGLPNLRIWTSPRIA